MESVLAALSVLRLLLLDSTLFSDVESCVSSVEDVSGDVSEIFGVPLSPFLAEEDGESDPSAWSLFSLLLLTRDSCRLDSFESDTSSVSASCPLSALEAAPEPLASASGCS